MTGAELLAQARTVRALEQDVRRATRALNLALAVLDQMATAWAAERGLGHPVPTVTANPPLDPTDPVVGVVPRDPRQPDWGAVEGALAAVGAAFKDVGEQVEAERAVHRRAPLPPGVIRRHARTEGP